MSALFRSRMPEPAVVEPVPTVFPQIQGAQLAAVFVGNRIAGDFYDSIRVSPERVLFGMLDVAGRRTENRSLLIKAQQIFRETGSELFSASDLNESEAVTTLTIQLNRGLIEASGKVHSCPAFIGCYHEKFGTLCYTNAGHTPGLLRAGSGILRLPSTGLPLGLFSHATHEAPTIAIEKNSAILLVSRGVIECGGQNGQSEEFGLERVEQLLRGAHSEGAEQTCKSILNAADGFCPTSAPRDDRTALALVRSN